MYEQIYGITTAIDCFIEDRPDNKGEMVAWVDSKQHLPDLLRYIGDFDLTVNVLNKLLSTRQFDEVCTNVVGLRDALMAQRLPTIGEMLVGNDPDKRGNHHTLGRALKVINARRVHERHIRQPKSYHSRIWESEPGVGVAGGIFYVYAEYMRLHYGLKRSDLVVNALMEALVLTPLLHKNDLFHAIADTNGLNWVQGNDAFSLRIQEMARM